MKVALLLCGQFRDSEDCYPPLYENLLKHYDTDIFVSYWHDGILDVDSDKIVNLYKPKAIEFNRYEQTIIDNFNFSYNYHYYGESSRESFFKMWNY